MTSSEPSGRSHPGRVELDVDGGVATIRLTNPRRRNAVDGAMYESLCSSLEEVDGDADVRVVILTGSGSDFSSGFELSGDLDPAAVERTSELLLASVRSIHGLDIPVVARIRGVAYGAGCGLAMACDLRVSARSARFCMPVVKLGAAYPVDLLASFVDALGLAATLDLFLTGRVVDGADACGLGLVHRCVADDDLDAEVAAVVAGLLDAPSAAIAYLKEAARALREQMRPTGAARARLEQSYLQVITSDEAHAARTAFRGRGGAGRPPAGD